MAVVLALLAVLAAQLPTLQQPPAETRPEGTAEPSALVQAAEAARAQQATRERIAALTREAAMLERQSASLLDELRRLDVERDLQRAREAEAREARRLLEADLRALTTRQDALQAVLDRERPAVAARLRRVQRLGRVGYSRIAWNAGRARDVGRASRLMTYLARDDGRRLTAYRETAEALAETQTRLTGKRTEARALETEAAARRAAAERAYAGKQQLLAEIAQESGQRERWLAALIEARAKLDATVSATPATAVPTPTLRAPLTTRQRQLPWPVTGDVVERFGRQRDSRFGTVTVNNGIAVAASAGTPVRAVHGGTVAFAGPFSGFGQLVIVDHGRQAYSLYGYLSSLGVQRGETVEAGSLIGDTGEGPDGRPSLYFEVRVDGRPVDPLQWLTRAQ